MRKWFFFLIFTLVLFLPLDGKAQDSTFSKIQGDVYGSIFANYHMGLNKTDVTAFELKRAHFGYKAQLSKYFNANVKLDIGSPDDLSDYSLIRRYAYFKNAYVNYSKDKFKVYFGIIGLLQFKIQEKYWAHRYIQKSFCDEYKFGSSADLGAQTIYKFADWLSADFTVMNGEGYTKLQSDNTLTGGLGVSIVPYHNFVFRVYGDFSEKDEIQTTVSTFVGYKLGDKAIGGVEYNWRSNDSYDHNHDRYGYSVYMSYYPMKKLQVFARYDKVESNILADEYIPWELSSDGSAAIAGVEYSPIKYVKMALNYQDWFPLAENEANEQYLYLNLLVKF